VATVETDGFSRRLKLRLIEGVGFAVMVGGGVLLVLGYWHRGLGLLVLGAFVLLHPTQIVGFIERFLPRE
jgi:hypothetical protein